MDAKVYLIGDGQHSLKAQVVNCGKDLQVTVTGGVAHVGAVAMAIPRESLTGEGTSASVSVLCVPGHRDDELARHMAHRIASQLNCRVSVTAGIHIEGASPADIQTLVENGDNLADLICTS